MREASGRGSELGRAGGQQGKRVTAGRESCVPPPCGLLGWRTPFSITASQPLGRGLLPRKGRWRQSLEDARQAEQMVRGQCDCGGHFSRCAGWNLKSGPLVVSDGR